MLNNHLDTLKLKMKAKYTSWKKPSTVWSKLRVLGIPELTGIFKRMDLKNIHMNTQYMWKKGAYGIILFVCLYVDDLLFTGNNPTMFEAFKKSMVQEFEMTNIGLMAHFLGLEVVQKKRDFCIPKQLCQRHSWKVQDGKLQSGINSSWEWSIIEE